MTAEPVQVEIELPGAARTLRVPPDRSGEPLSDLLRSHGLPLNTRCGGRGLCEGCVLELRSGRLARLDGGPVVAGEAELRGCEHRLADTRPVRLRVPARALLAYEPQVVSEFRLNVPRAHDPLPHAGDRHLAVAIDVGTTTVALLLVDLADGAVLSRASGFNRQLHLGDDVLTRIQLCRTDPALLGELQRVLVRDTIRPLLAAALDEAGASLAQIAALSAAGNSTMLHLLAGADPSSMGVAPFAAAFLEHRVLDAAALGIGPLEAPVHLLPGAAAYVGADVCAGVLASALAYEPGPSLLVDVGTNGEIVLQHGQRLAGCATAAGPAFEGSRLTSGMRAGTGAVAHLQVTGDPLRIEAEVIGAGRPSGICGSAYVEFLAAGRAAGLLGATGRVDADAAGELLVEEPTLGRAVRIATGRGRSPLCISERDVASLLQAKAAVAAGILTLLEREGLEPKQVERLHLAGGFGMHLDPRHAIGCGLLPEFAPEQIQVVGNTALAGAYLALVDRGVIGELTRLARALEVVELNLDSGFERRYVDNLVLPGPDAAGAQRRSS